jgi:hypothetical protein
MSTLQFSNAPRAASLVPCTPKEIRVKRVRVGKINARFTGTGGVGRYVPLRKEVETNEFYKLAYPDGRDQPWEHKLLVEIEWEPAATVHSYKLCPVIERGIDLQHTTHGNQNRFLICIDQHRLDQFFGEFMILGIGGNVVWSRYGVGPLSYTRYESKPFKLELKSRFDAINGVCALCLEEPIVSPIDDAPPLPEIPPLAADVDPWWVQQRSFKVAAREKHQNLISTRNRTLDHRDVLLCGHSFCRPCMDQYREQGIPQGQFDVACPICRDVVKSEEH